MTMTKSAAARMTRSLVTIVMAAALIGGCASRNVYGSERLEGTVTDAATGQPIGGAVVLTLWYQEIPVAPHGPAYDLKDSLEVVTDENGRFTIPKRTHIIFIGEMEGPTFSIWAPGYAPYPSAGTSPRNAEEFNAGIAHGRLDVKLPKLKTREERVRYADLTDETISLPASRFPKMLEAINRERQALGLSPIGALR